MKKILITAFEPFGGQDMNSSAMVLDKVKNMSRDNVIAKMTLPVLYSKAFKMLKTKINDMKPDIIVCLGQKGGAAEIRIERIAVNINNSSHADNDGIVISDETIEPDGDTAYFSNLPHKKMLEASKGYAIISYSAGTYICNDVFYRLMNYIDKEKRQIRGGFIHLPFTEHFGKMPYIDLDIQVDTVESMLKVIGE